jgi:hypothetical protein
MSVGRAESRSTIKKRRQRDSEAGERLLEILRALHGRWRARKGGDGTAAGSDAPRSGRSSHLDAQTDRR